MSITDTSWASVKARATKVEMIFLCPVRIYIVLERSFDPNIHDPHNPMDGPGKVNKRKRLAFWERLG